MGSLPSRVKQSGLNGLLELLHVKRTAEERVFLDRAGLDPSLLGAVCDSAIAVDFARYAHRLSNNCKQERALSRTDITDDCSQGATFDSNVHVAEEGEWSGSFF